MAPRKGLMACGHLSLQEDIGHVYSWQVLVRPDGQRVHVVSPVISLS